MDICKGGVSRKLTTFFGKSELAATLRVGNPWQSYGGSWLRRGTEPRKSWCCWGRGSCGAVGSGLWGRQGAVWEGSQDLQLRGSLCVPAARSRRSWEPQRWIPDADKDINFVVQLQAPRRV